MCHVSLSRSHPGKMPFFMREKYSYIDFGNAWENINEEIFGMNNYCPSF